MHHANRYIIVLTVKIKKKTHTHTPILKWTSNIKNSMEKRNNIQISQNELLLLTKFAYVTNKRNGLNKGEKVIEEEVREKKL